MKRNGFIASALLYGMLALFLVVMLSTLAILGNRKLGMDKLRENALTTVETGYVAPEDVYAIYDGLQQPVSNQWVNQSGDDTKNLTVSGTVFNTDHLTFDGNDYISGSFDQTTFGDAFTFITTVEIGDFSSGRGLWGYYDTTNYKGTTAMTNGSGLDVCLYDSYGNDACVTIAGTLLTGKKQLAVLLGDGGVSVYINGGLVAEQGTPGAFAPYTSATFRIGQGTTATASRFIGNMYNFLIYKDRLTAEEIMANFEVDKVRYNIG